MFRIVRMKDKGNLLNILFLSFYFRPDLCAGSFRNTAVVDELLRQLPDSARIDLITTKPNRYASYSVDAAEWENQEQLRIHRISLPAHDSGMFDQSRAFVTYAREVLKQIKTQQYDMIYASSARLLTASLGAYISKKYRIPLYLDIRDIFIDGMKDILPPLQGRAFRTVFSPLEKWTVHQARWVNLVSEGNNAHFNVRYPDVRFRYFTNWIDDLFLASSFDQPKASKDCRHRVLYAGNIGEGQGLHCIIPELARRFHDRLEFRIIGGGGRQQQLMDAIAHYPNVELCPPMDRDQLIGEYREADVLFLHLNSYETMKKVLPSKIFEYGATGKPIWAGVDGYPAEFVKEHIDNAVVFKPCDAIEAERVFSQLELCTKPRPEFCKAFSREGIVSLLVADVLKNVDKESSRN